MFVNPITYIKLAAVGLFMWCTSTLAAESTRHTVDWQVGNRLSDSISTPVMMCSNAIYNDGNVPVIEHTITLNQHHIHTIVSNAQYERVPDEELKLIEQVEIPSTLQTETSVINQQGNYKAYVHIFPFIQENGEIKRLVNYTLETKESTAKLPSGTTMNRYKNQSVLANGHFVKIRVSSSGIYRLTYEELQNMGVDPAQARIFGYGGAELNRNFSAYRIDDLPEVPVYVYKGTDNQFGPGDYILFHAQGPISWNYEYISSLGQRGFTHNLNTYSQYGYYFVTSSTGNPQRLNAGTDATFTPADTVIVNSFIDYQLHEQELVNLQDPTGQNGGGDEFYGEQFSNSHTQENIAFQVNNPTTESARVCISAVANSTSGSSTLKLSMNGGTEQTMLFNAIQPSIYIMGTESEKNYYFPLQGGSNTLKINASMPSGSYMYLNWVELHAQRALTMVGNSMYFRTTTSYNTNLRNRFIISNAPSDLQVWNITRLDSIYRMPTQLIGNELHFASGNRTIEQFVAVAPNAGSNAYKTPEVVGSVTQQNLHQLKDIEYVIITPEIFRSEANRLAAAHEEINGLTTAVVSDEEVYNEFSSGTPDASAYRWLMKMLYDRHTTGESTLAPRYLLLMGDGTFDNRKLLSQSGPNLLLTYQSDRNNLDATMAYPTDDYFGFLDDNSYFSETQMYMNIGIGRFPVSTIDQARNMVNKTIAYMNNTQKGSWKNQLCFLADDGDGTQHMASIDTIAQLVKNLYPEYVSNKIILDSYLQEVTASGESYPIAKNKFDNFLRNGMLYFCYMGHGSPSGITNEGMLTLKEIQTLANAKQAVWALGTCSFSHWDSQVLSAGEEAVLNPNGGAIGVFSAARTVYADQNERLLIQFSKNMFIKENGDYLHIGDVVMNAKNANRESNRMSYCYLGDPAVKIVYPQPYTVETDSINDKSAVEGDTLRALSTNVLKGKIVDEDGQIVTDFQGKAYITVYDKEQTFATLNNHNDIPEEKYPFTYKDRIGILFKGEAIVTDGKFETRFMVPKDIQYNYGTGRITYYANDTLQGTEGIGYYENYTVGGSDPDVVYETDGPEVDIYLNSTQFVSGGQVDERPMFIAYLSDPNGINTSGSGIGHDLLLTIDNSSDQSWNLNEVFVTTGGDYRQGSIHYKMAEMTEGKHTLSFRAWDLLNNSTTKTLDFEVVKNLAPEIFDIISYPNPIRSAETLHIDIIHDRPESILEVEINIFDVSGRRVYSMQETCTTSLTIQPQEAFCGGGVYLYQMRIRTQNSEYTTKTRKIIVIGQ